MKNLKVHIQKRSFMPVYLLYGDEEYLKKTFKDMLKQAVLEGSDDINYSFFDGAVNNTGVIRDIADTMPFFSDRRLIIAENSGLFKSANDFADYVPEIPKSTVVVFIENEVDRRSRLYKAVRDNGYVCELKRLTPEELKNLAAVRLNKAGKRITVENCEYLIKTVGNDTLNLINEVEKLIAYTGDRETVVKKDIDEVCISAISNKIFDMIDAMGSKNRQKAMALYFDLLSLREKPLTILYLIIRHFNRLLLIEGMVSDYCADADIAAKAGIPSWYVKNYKAQLKYYDRPTLINLLKEGTELEEKIKTGRVNEQIGVEIMLAIQTSV